MTSVYLVRRGDEWLREDYHLCVKVFEDSDDSLGVSHPADAAIFATRERAAAAARTYGGGEPVEFREVTKDAAFAVARHVGRVAPLPLDEFGDTIAESLAKDGLTESDLIGGES